MKLRSIHLKNVRRFVDPVEVGGIGDGLNVLSTPNEHGKSTVFDALHAVFFKPRKSWDREIRSLAPHAGGDPSVTVEVELADGIYRIEKRWNNRRNGDARVETGSRLIGQADAAEAWIAEILKAPRDGGPAGLLWVRQGLTGLDDGDAARLARRDLLTSVAGEVEAMTGGRRMDAARDRCHREVERYLTPKGRPKTDGPLKRISEEVSSLQAAQQDLSKKSEQLRRQLDRRQQIRQALADLENPDEQERRATRLAEAEAAHAEAARYAEQLERARTVEHTKRIEVGRAEENLASLNMDLAELAEATEAHREATDLARQAVEQLHQTEASTAKAESAHRSARTRAESAANALRKVLLARDAAASAARRRDLIEKIERAEEFRRRVEQGSAQARTELSDSVVEELEQLDETVRVLRQARDLKAAGITMTYAPGLTAGVSLGGIPLPGGERISIFDGARLEIDNIGGLDIYLGQRSDGETLSNAEAELARILESVGTEGIEDARASARRRRDAELRARNANTDLQSVAPDGIDVLRDRLAAIPEQIADRNDLPAVEEAQQEDESARQVLAQALEEYEIARIAQGHAVPAAARATTTVENAGAREARARAALSGIDDPESEKAVLQAALMRLRAGLEDVTRRLQEMKAVAPDPEAATTALERARSILRRAEEERQRFRLELVELDTSIGIQAGEAVEEELADADIRLETAETRLAGLEFEVAVLKKLGATLDEARASARDRYVEPVMTELVPLLQLFWPEAELRFDPETLLPTALMRAGAEESFDILSGGTQEQIALLVRLAFARMLAKAGTPAPIILDDAIVYTDDDRIERMFDALTHQARDLQIVVFSCRQKAFRDLGGRGLEIVPAIQSREAR